ncbi:MULTISPECIES: NUDIX hydrolase [Prauserella salsuginis group]|uniref:NUDIX hydrolase n=1 Tax=Prauserella salsuginis TaxID=387889 RepID=A0ABW6G2Y0_9PSEU|nr:MULTISPECIES: NUDIX hydrolase [Prauserella salsuginis group]MCR3718442.1 8-oxo-dGTP diphosphatase [Prauserella flava]MCR3733012.1 8-oxo-dGTP diphosphatase [Prauserella salsuginis]
MTDDTWSPPHILLAVDLVILTLRETHLHVLLVERGIEPYRGCAALPGGFLNNDREGLLAAAHRELDEEADLDATQLHLEQLGTYGDANRDPRGRVVSVTYLAIAPRLPEPTAGTDAARAAWRPVDAIVSGELPLAFDHDVIIADGIERARSKLEHTPLATAFCEPVFTISDLQQVYEAVWGVDLDPRNFYRKVQKVPNFLLPVDAERRVTKGRPARLFTAGPATTLHPPIPRPDHTASRQGE